MGSMWKLWGGGGRLIRWETLEADFHEWQSHVMTDLDNILIFIKVAQFESISQAPLTGDADLNGESQTLRARVVRNL
jgi:hypothetical protein